MSQITKPAAISALRECVATRYVIECSRCKNELEHECAVAPKGKGDLTFVAEMAYDDGWLIAGGIFSSSGEMNGSFTLFPICPTCAAPTDKPAES